MTLDDATLRQIEAATPTQSNWLSANAGSGKTRVLTDRVARLLLEGTRPENILCLTYTKAAASEMQNRLFKRLGEWAMLPEGKLRRALTDLGDDTTISVANVRRARTLFAAAIETPGGLKIQTIHSFCAGILRRFPREAGISPQFQEMEDRAADLLRSDVLDELANAEPEIMATFAKHFTGAEIGTFLTAVTGRKGAFLNPPSDAKLGLTFDLPSNATDDAVVATILTAQDNVTISDVVTICQPSGTTDQKAAATLSSLDLSQPLDINALPVLETVFLFGDSAKTPFGPKVGSFPTKAVREANPAITDALNDLMERVAEGRDLRLRWETYKRTRALYDFASVFVERYEARKTSRAMLDFDDLIGKAKALLEDPVVAQWVLFRLDGGVDHVLVDEAQDTSPEQWDIIRLLTQEFSTGEGSRSDRQRTLFVVGDKKQSIYSFQGADPDGFDRMRDYFSDRLERAKQTLYNRELQYSFRSSEAILRLVDQVFTGPMLDGIGAEPTHLAFHSEMPGRVDLWEPIPKIKGPEEKEWDDPIDTVGETNEKVRLAKAIADEIKRIIANETLPVFDKETKIWSRRPITEGDFLILVQRRSDLFSEIISACKRADLQIAGADRLRLGGELAVKDISSLLRFLALPEDDLSLAEALKSPLFGWSEKELYDLAQPRPERQTLWEALRKSVDHAETVSVLRDLRDQSDFLRPYDLINRILLRHDGRRNLLARLGQEAEDGIDALLAQALSYEQADVPSLTGFISWMQTEDVEIKRQVDNAGDRLRVMTVHGAKGLEAPIVILPDSAKRNSQARDELLADGETTIWKPRSANMPDDVRALQQDVVLSQARERRRLLYVALTRAENWLIVAAAGETESKTADPQHSWHATVKHALSHLDSVTLDGPTGIITRFYRHEWSDH
ncbi:MAG: double-strand break repair helicase AddA [Pseudomonadota bacterium]